MKHIASLVLFITFAPGCDSDAPAGGSTSSSAGHGASSGVGGSGVGASGGTGAGDPGAGATGAGAAGGQAGAGATGGEPGTGGRSQPCGPAPAPGYPDAKLSFDPAPNNFGGPITALPGESPDGAAAGRIGPIPGLTAVSKAVVVLQKTGSCVLPDPVAVAVWAEPDCDLPSQPPAWESVNLSAADVADFPNQGNLSKVTVTLGAPVAVAPGDSVYVAVRLTAANTCPVVWAPGRDPSRAVWFGLVDDDDDGKVDPQLGWATLAAPTAPGVGSYPFDLGFGIE